MQRFGDHRQGSALLLRCRVGSLLGLTPESCLAQDMTRGMAMWPPSIASSKSSQCRLTCNLTPADSCGTGYSPSSSGPAMVHFHRASALCWTRLPSPAPIQDLHNHAGSAQLLHTLFLLKRGVSLLCSPAVGAYAGEASLLGPPRPMGPAGPPPGRRLTPWPWGPK